MSKSGESIMKRDSRGSSITESGKRLHFDEDNIRSTYYPKDENHIFRPLTDGNKSLQRFAEPIDPVVLRKKLEILQAKQAHNDGNLPKEQSFDLTSSPRDLSTGSSMDLLARCHISADSEAAAEHAINATPQETFEEKRKRFHKNEYKKTQHLTTLEPTADNSGRDFERFSSNSSTFNNYAVDPHCSKDIFEKK